VPRQKFDPNQIFAECNGASAPMQQLGIRKFMIAKEIVCSGCCGATSCRAPVALDRVPKILCHGL
jgi:hypothetical protein